MTNNSLPEILRDREWLPGKGLSAFDSGANYLGDDQSGYIVGIAQTRDSDVLDRSNFAVMLEALGDADGELVRIHGVNHWACGWVDQILVRADATDKLKILADMLKRLEDYPILNEDHFSQLENDEANETFDNNLDMFMNNLRNVLEVDDIDKDEGVQICRLFFEVSGEGYGLSDAWVDFSVKTLTDVQMWLEHNPGCYKLGELFTKLVEKLEE